MKNRIEKLDSTEKEGETQQEDDSLIPAPETDASKKPEKKEPRERAGAILKREREKQGISIENVHETTKIPLDALRAIEEGYTIRMLSPFYYSGFVKMYAHYLNIDAAEVIDDYSEEKLPEPIEEDLEDFEIPKWFGQVFTNQRKEQLVIAAVGIGALILLFAVINLFISKKPTTPAPELKVAVVPEPVKKEIKKAALVPINKVQSQAPKIAPPKQALIVTPPKPKAVAKPVSNPVIKPAAGIVPPAAVQKNINLTVRANQNSWLRVKTDGAVVFQSTLRVGAVETWFADDDIEISGRNINELEFELNGKMIGTLGRKDRNAKKVVITKDGLSVEK